ncbi:MAG: MFS transporter, partial [Hoeflea sp.]|nr:MFS transporter [Hoeflea sp.]
AHANDKAKAGEYVQIASGLMFFWAIAASIGPLLSAVLVDWLGAASFFVFMCTMHGAFVVYTVLRMLRGEPGEPGRGRFTALLRTSPIFARMAAQSVASPADPDGDAQTKAERTDAARGQDKEKFSG